MKFFSKAENLCAAGLIAAFFLPWVNIGGVFSIAGYRIPDIINGLSQFGGLLQARRSQPDPETYLFYALYLVPLLALNVIVRGTSGKDTRAAGLLAGILPMGGFAYLVSKVGKNVFQVMGIGAYLTLFFALATILAVLGIVKVSTSASSESPGVRR